MLAVDSLTALRVVLPTLTKGELVELLADVDDDTAEVLLYDWELWARPEQLPPAGEWFCWLILAGRGWGKSRTGAEFVRGEVEAGRAGRIALIGETAADVRDVMVEGESGILAVSPPWFRPKYEVSKRRVTWPNGALATCYSGEDPDQLRGPQHDLVWSDELAKWRYAEEAWSNMEFGLRLGNDPRVVVTTTPRPIPIVRQLIADPGTVRPTSNLSTHLNRANVSKRFVDRVITRYAGTRLGRQELDAEVLDDTPGALWTLSQIEAGRVRVAPPLIRIVVGVDPPASTSGECGIVTAGKDADDHGYVIADDSKQGTPAEWGEAVITAFIREKADKIIAEKNNGGDMVEHTIRTSTAEIGGVTIRGANLPIEMVWASRGKQTRAEPISVLYGNDKQAPRVHHVGAFPVLENEMTTYVPGDDSPNHMDAQVWALTALFPNEAENNDDAAVGGTPRGGQSAPTPGRLQLPQLPQRRRF